MNIIELLTSNSIHHKLDTILINQQVLFMRLNKMAQTLQALNDYAKKIDAATDLIAARIQKLIDQIGAGTVTPEQIAAALQPEVDKLNAMGVDPTVPPVA